MIKHLLFTAFLFLGGIIYTFGQQKFPIKTTTPQHLLLQKYEPDTTANALVLYEQGKATIEKDEHGIPHLFFEHYVKVKIFNKNGLDKATIEIPLYHSSRRGNKEVIEMVEAMATNTDRSVSRTNKNEVYYEDLNENVSLAKFTIPNVKPGCVIDYKYVVKSDYFYNFKTWYFQDDIPKLHSEFHTNIPGNYKYNTALHGPLQLDHKEGKIIRDCFEIAGLGRADCVAATYVMKDIPAFIEENFMTAKKNYLAALRFELTTFESFRGGREHYAKTWEAVDRELKSSSIGKESDREKYFSKHLPENLLTGPADLKKARDIYQFLKEKLYWNQNNHLHREADVKNAFEEGRGSSTELNLILLNALKAAGYKVRPMLVSTRNNGIPSKTIPGITQFNALIIKLDLDNRSYLLDIVNKQHPFGLIRKALLNQYGRVLDFKEGSYWYGILPPETYSKRSYQTYIDLQNDKARYREISTGYDALRARQKYSSEGEDEYFDNIASRLEARGNFTLVEYENKYAENYEKPFSESYQIELNRTKDQDRLLLNPFLMESFSNNPFKLVQRTYPVDFAYPFSISFTVLINLGEKYAMETRPENKEIHLPDGLGSLRYNIKDLGDQIKVDLNLDMLNPIIPTTHYEALKEFFNEFVRIQNKNPITLIKRSKLLSENAGK